MEIITSRQNPLCTHIRKLAGSASYRRQSGEFLCDSPKLLEEAILWNAPLTTVVCTDAAALPPLPEAVRVVVVPADVMKTISPMESPQGMLGLVRMPQAQLPEKLEGGRYLVLDGVQDPGNVGTILRTADAFEGDGVFLLPGCADIYSPKTVRATMGALFRRPVRQIDLKTLCKLLADAQLPLIGAALGENTLDVRELPARAALAIGSEGRGLSRETLDACDSTVRIPMSSRCESLNAAVAASVLLWELYRND